MPGKKEIKIAEKSGGKIAQDICGINETGGMSYFTLEMPLCKGSQELLKIAMDAANVPVDESTGDRKGGAGELAKCLVTSDDKQDVVIMMHVPPVLKEILSLEKWYEAVTAGMNGKVVEKSDEFIIHVSYNDPGNDFYALKMKDQAVAQSIAILREHKLIVEDDDDYDFGEMYAQAGIEW